MTTRDIHDDDDAPVDLTALLGGREALAARIVAAAGPELARRRARALSRVTRVSLVDGVAALVARFATPALVAAAAALFVAIGASRTEEPSGDLIASSATASDLSVQQALRGDVGSWIAQQRAPNTADLLGAVDDGDQE